MKKTIIVILTVVLLLACGNTKTRQTEPITNDDRGSVEQSEPDTITSSVQEKMAGSISIHIMLILHSKAYSHRIFQKT